LTKNILKNKLNIKTMKNFIILLLMSFLSHSIIAKSYKINLSLKNSSDKKLSVSYQKGFVLDTSNGSNIYIGDLSPGETKLFDDKEIIIQKGETIYIIISLNGSNISVASFRAQNKPPKPLSLEINPPNKNSIDPITSQASLENRLKNFGINDISSGNKLRTQLNFPLRTGMNIVCGALILVDMSLVDNNNEFKYGDVKYVIPSYLLKTIPDEITPDGQSINDEFEFESDISLAASSSFPLAGSLNFGFSNSNYYKSKIEVKNSGWIPLRNSSPKGQVAGLASISDNATRLDIATDLKDILDKCKNCKMWVVSEAFFYESLVLTTSKFDRLSGTSDASVSSVVSLNGAYKRQESKDFTDSRGSTIAYIALTNDVTASLKKTINQIIENAYLESLLQNISVTINESTSSANKDFSMEKFGLKSLDNKSSNIEDYIDKEKLELFKSMSKDKLNSTLKANNKEF
jgi:hypothetical protein